MKKKGFAVVNIVYWFVLLYTIAALVWWFIALQNQNRQMTNYKLMELKADDPAYLSKIEILTNEQQRKTAQYIGEGATFLLLIMIGALFVYRAVRKRIRLSQQQQNFMMAVTHELKTPISVAKLNLETLQKHQLDEEKQRKLLQMTLLETNRLDALTNNILISSQLEAGGYKLTREDLDLSALVQEATQAFKGRFTNRVWNISLTPDIAVKGDLLLLQMLVNNLLDNAVKYSPKQSSISISLHKKNGGSALTITDEGIGIPSKEKKKIFERFYRVGDEEHRKTKGTGLGLYLCKKIAEDHNASISVTDNSPIGTNFTVYFK